MTHGSTNTARSQRALLFVVGLSAMAAGQAVPQANPPGPVADWVRAASVQEVALIQQQGTFSVRYREHKIDTRGDTTREVIESKEGTVARLLERNGSPLTAAEDSAEKDRLNQALNNREEFLRHHKRDNTLRGYIVDLVKQMPRAMVYSYAPGQPQVAGASQVVLDFHPDPAFHPSTMMADILTGLEGRLWIDTETRRVLRAEAHIIRPVNFGWGVLARIAPGGTVEFEQTDAGAGRWMYSHVDEHLTVRELMVKTQVQNTSITSAGFRILPTTLGYQEAIRELLTMQIPLRP